MTSAKLVTFYHYSGFSGAKCEYRSLPSMVARNNDELKVLNEVVISLRLLLSIQHRHRRVRRRHHPDPRVARQHRQRDVNRRLKIRLRVQQQRPHEIVL